MPTDATTLTLALILTAGGAVGAAAIVSGVVEMLKNLAPTIIGGKEQVTAFFLSGLLVIVAEASAFQSGAITLNIASLFGGFMAFYAIARIAMGIHDDVTGSTPTSLRA